LTESHKHEVIAMPLPGDVTAKLLMDAIKEDRTEIRLMKDRIYANTSLITVASFALTPFIWDKAPQTDKWAWFVLTDCGLLMLLWVLFIKLVKDVNLGQRYMEAREKKLHAVQQGDPPAASLLVFSGLNEGVKQGIRHRGLHLIVTAASMAILAKLAAIVALIGGVALLRQ
jgi:hypothetical protein